MYLIVGFFNEDEVKGKRKYFSERYVTTVKNAFSNYLDLNNGNIERAIGYYMGKQNSEKPCFLMDITNIRANEKSIIINFQKGQELPNTSEEISREIYKKSWQLGWTDKETGYFPLVLILDKNTFDSIRKCSANIRKLTDIGERVKELKKKNQWKEICKLYEPLENIHNKPEIWDNPVELYDIGYACSKMGELKNGLERDPNHLKEIKRYRDLSLKIYKRCYELNPKDYRYASSVAYRYYQNVNELTKPKGRRDGIAIEEIKNAHAWFDISLELYPESIKDNYRKGKMILDKQIDIMRYSGMDLTSEDFKGIDNLKGQAIKCLNKVIESYELITDGEKKNYYRNEYIKSLYTLAKFYIDEVNLNWDEYLCRRIGNKPYLPFFSKEEYLDYGKSLLAKCYKEVTDLDVDDELDIKLLFAKSKKAKIPPIDLVYSLGKVYSRIYFIKSVKKDKSDNEVYRSYAYKFLNGAIALRDEFKKQGIRFKRTDYIDYSLANLNIIDGKYIEAIKMTNMCRDDYIKNTYAAALILSNDKNNIKESIRVLRPLIREGNKTKKLSIALLAKAYELMGQEKEKLNLINDYKDNKHVDKLLEIIL